MKFETKVKRIFIKAAKRIESGKNWFSCIAINEAAQGVAVYDSTARMVAKEHYARLFAPFKRGDGSSNSNYGERGRPPMGSGTFWNKDKTRDPVRNEQLKRERVNALLAAAASFAGTPEDFGFGY